MFYLGFPLLCLWLPRRLLVAVLLVWALALEPLRTLVPASEEVWRQKAYLPGMAALAWGVLTAMLAGRWRPRAPVALALGLAGAVALVLVLGWSGLVYRHLFKSNLSWICAGTCLLLLAFHARPPAPLRGLGWLAQMGRLSYELYLSHMFIVLAAAGLYRALLGETQTWTFAVYLPVLLCCYALAQRLERGMARLTSGLATRRARGEAA